MVEEFEAALFPDDGENAYAIIDGASCEELLDKLDAFHPEHFCLYAGELEPDLAEVAPYIVELLPDHPFTGWLLAEGFGKHWGIFARSPANLRAMRKHFRGFLLVKDFEGKTIYFRYYDPRVLHLYLSTANERDLDVIFGGISSLIGEVGGDQFLFHRSHDGELESTPWPKTTNPP